jgi:hypothetical protein
MLYFIHATVGYWCWKLIPPCMHDMGLLDENEKNTTYIASPLLILLTTIRGISIAS